MATRRTLARLWLALLSFPAWTAASQPHAGVAPPGEDPRVGSPQFVRSLREADEMLERKEYGPAARRYVELWKSPLGESFMFSRLRGLQTAVEHSDEARQAVEAYRAELVGNGVLVSPEQVERWMQTNDLLGETQKSLEWFEKTMANPKRRHIAESVRAQAFAAYIKCGKWREAGLALGGQQMVAESMLERAATSEPDPDTTRYPEGRRHRILWEAVVQVQLAFRAAGRDAEADDLTKLMTDKDKTGNGLLIAVAMAVRAGRASPEQRQWLDAAAAKGADVSLVRPELDAALARPASTATVPPKNAPPPPPNEDPRPPVLKK